MDERTITDDDIRALRAASIESGNRRRITLCDLALGLNPIGRSNARRLVAQLINWERNPPPHIPAGTYKPAQVIELARKLGVPGELVSRSRAYETRKYASHQWDNPWVIIARPEQHYTGEES